MDWVATAIVLVIGAFVVSVLAVLGVVVWSDAKAERVKTSGEEAVRAVLEGEEARTAERTEAHIERLRRETEELRSRDSVEVANELLREERRKGEQP